MHKSAGTTPTSRPVIMLLVFTVAVVIAMFRGVAIPELVTTIIGAVLGYFFAQSQSRRD